MQPKHNRELVPLARVDFYCARVRLVIELDGFQHAQPDAVLRDAERTAFLQSYGLQVLRQQEK